MSPSGVRGRRLATRRCADFLFWLHLLGIAYPGVDQPPIDNRTDFVVHPQLLLDREGERLVVIVKATYELLPDSPALELAAPGRMRPPWFADVPWGEPEVSSIAYATNLFVRKPGTDVLVVGEGCAPNGQPVPSFDTFVRVGALQKACRVFGLRVWEANGAGLTPPAPIDRVEMRYDYAWGGFDDSDPERVVEEPRNPVGKGCVRDVRALTHQPAPNIEDPRFPIRDCRTRPPPAGIGPIGRNYEPRRRYAGTYDQAWQDLRAPLPPKDFDDRFNSSASEGLFAEEPLWGGEEVGLLNLTPGGGAKRFFLPRVQPRLEFRVQSRDTQSSRPPLDTVLIDTLGIGLEKPLAVELTWRASVKAPRRMKDSLTIVYLE